MNQPPKNLRTFESLVEIMKTLRSPTGCPWDKEQTHQSITPHALEEVCELIEAIETKDEENLKEELGDVLLQVIFHAEISRGEKRFDIYDVLERLNTKLVTRHPHVFTENSAQNSSEALVSWNTAKSKESKRNTGKVFEIPTHLPALQYAQKIGDKTKKFHFDWDSAQDVFVHVEEEVQEFKEAMSTNQNHLEEEFGDLIFTLVQTARHLKIDAERALRTTNAKVERRWTQMKELANQQKQDFEKLNTEELNVLWKEVKKTEKPTV